MIVADTFSFNSGEVYIRGKYPDLLKEITDTIENIDGESCRLKAPKGAERKKLVRIGVEMFYSPLHLNSLFDYFMHEKGWELKPRIITHDPSREGFREMDFIKRQLGVEVQFGKYSFLTYDIVAKMIIFKNYGLIDAGIEICPMANMLPHLSSGIGAFEQVKWDLIKRGAIQNFDLPALLIGVTTEVAQQTLRPIRRRDQGQLALPEVIDASDIKRGREPDMTEKTLKKVRETGLAV